MSFSRPHLNAGSCISMKVYEDDQRSNKVLAEMYKFYHDKRFCDVTLKIEGQAFKTHRIVLAASSVYFERMFSNGMTEAEAEVVVLNDVSSKALEQLLEFAYASRLEISQDTALDIFEAADMLQFTTARSFCESFLAEQVNSQNCLHFMLYADAFSCKPLHEKATVCAANHFKIISNGQEFMKLPLNHMKAILRQDSIDMEYEEHVYEAMRNWVMHDKNGRTQYLTSLFRCIRLNFVSRWYLIEVICKDELVNNCEEAMKMVQHAKDQLLAQGHTYEIPWQLPPSRRCTGMTEKIIFVNTHDPNPGESELFLFDVINKSWSTTSKSCPYASQYSTCEHFGDSLLVIGGWNQNVSAMNMRGAVNAIHEYKAMSIFPTLWYTGVHVMDISRYLHSSIVVGQKLFILGGMDENQIVQSSVHLTDLDNRYLFQVCPPMIHAACRPALAHLENRIFVFGGFDGRGTPMRHVQQYDISKGKWSELPTLPLSTPVTFQYACSINSTIYVFYGSFLDGEEDLNHDLILSHSIPLPCFDTVAAYNPSSYTWNVIYNFKYRRSGNFTFTMLADKIYITGGRQGGEAHNYVDCFDPDTNTLYSVGTAREGCLSLSTTMTIMHENFGL